MSERRPSGISEAIIGGFCLLVGGIVAYEVMTAPPIAVRAAVGPGAFPSMIAFGLVLIGLRLCFRAAYRPTGSTIAELDLKAFLLGSGALVFMILTLEWLGWILAGGIMFCLVALAFGERRYVPTAVIAFAMSGAIFYLFGTVLGLSLPLGRVFAG